MAAYEYLIVLCCLILILVTKEAESIYCYQCSDSANGGDCKNDISGLIDVGKTYENGTAPDEHTYPDIKDCSSQSGWNYCMIEEVSTRGDTMSYIRDCSDGKTFSYSSDKVPILIGINTKNQTTCGYYEQGYLICVSVCETDLCNGPRSRTGVISLSSSLLLFCTSLLFIFT